MAAKVDDAIFDKRLIERGMRNGTITQGQVDEHLKDLPDVTDAGELLDVTVLEEEVQSGSFPRSDNNE